MPDADSLDRPCGGAFHRLMLGIERGWRTREIRPHIRAAGLRAFGLSGLTGWVCGLPNPYSDNAAEPGPALAFPG